MPVILPYRLILGCCLEKLRTMKDDAIDSCVTDPPYELGFMGKKWDSMGIANNVEMWREVLRVLKPGGHLLSFGGTRTYHRMTCAIEDAGFEIRDQIGWLYGSGFPKSLDVSKAIDKAAGAEREMTGPMQSVPNHNLPGTGARFRNLDELDGERILVPLKAAPATDAARQWQGWGTALKPAWEPIVVARKPLIGTVAANVQTWGTGGLNIDGCRVSCEGGSPSASRRQGAVSTNPGCYDRPLQDRTSPERYAEPRPGEADGRWPANLIHDGSDEVVELFPVTSSGKAAKGGHKRTAENMTKGSDIYGGGRGIAGTSSTDDAGTLYGDAGSAARFFYCAKTSASERDYGLEEMELKVAGGLKDREDGSLGSVTKRRNHHPTVKPLALMRYLCRLVTPPNGKVLDPFLGSGSTGVAALREGFRFVGIEKEEQYMEIARRRLENEKTPSKPQEGQEGV